MEGSAVELSPSSRLFGDFTKILVGEYARARHQDETDAEVRDELVDSVFIRVDSDASQ